MSKSFHRIRDDGVVERTVEDGALTHVKKTQDVEPIMDAMKAIAEQSTPQTGTQTARRLLGTIPVIVGLQWAKESGLTMYSPEWLAYCRKKIMTDEFQGFRVQRKLAMKGKLIQ